jgi:hypothetical protein
LRRKNRKILHALNTIMMSLEAVSKGVEWLESNVIPGGC